MCCGTKFHKPDCLVSRCIWSLSWQDCENAWLGCAFGERAREQPALLQQLNQYSLHKLHIDHGMQLLQPAAATLYRNTVCRLAPPEHSASLFKGLCCCLFHTLYLFVIPRHETFPQLSCLPGPLLICCPKVIKYNLPSLTASWLGSMPSWG